MFDNLSLRAQRVLFVTRVNAGRRGADALDIGDLISAIIVEDQDMIGKFMGVEGEIGWPAGLEPHTPFFSARSASELLASIESVLSRSNPVPDSTDMPATADLNRVFQSAEGQREKSDHKRIEPSHLLAAVLEGTSRPELDLLRSAGITEESVRAKLEELYGNS